MLPSTAANVRILIKDDLGFLAAPTDDPTALLLRNGSDSGVTVVLTEVSEGIYTASWTNGAWSHGDELQLQVTAEFGSQTYVSIAWEGSIDVASSGGLDASGIRSAVGLSTANLDTQLGNIHSKTTNLPASPAATGAAMSLTSGERSTLAAAIESAMINEGDATALLQAIADKIAAANPSLGDLTLSAIASAVWSSGTRTLTENPGLDADGIRTAIGLSSANLDTRLDAIIAAFEEIECDGASADLSDEAVEAISQIVTDAIGGIRAQVFGLIIAGGDQITITQGNDYLTRSGNSILLDIERDGVDFTTATAEFSFGRTEGDPIETVTATIEDGAVGSCKVRVQLRKITTSHPSGQYRYDCRIFIPETEHDDEVITVIDGDLVVRPASGAVTLA